MDEQTKILLLKDEYSMLQQFYEDFDKRILGIKGWSATIALAAIGAGFSVSHCLFMAFRGGGFFGFLAPRIHLEEISVPLRSQN